REVELAGAFSIHGDLDGRVLERLAVLQVAQIGNPAEFPTNLFRELTILYQARSLHCHFDRRGRAEAHHLADNVSRLERKLNTRQFLGKALAQMLLELVAAEPCGGLEGYQHHGLMRA